MFSIMQGDSYSIAVEILDGNKEIVSEDRISDVEIAIGTLIKSYVKKEITYDSETGKWMFPLTQEETFSYIPSIVDCTVRVRWTNGDVEGTRVKDVRILESVSKEVL